MSYSRERGLHELYRQDPETADHRVWGRRCDPITRRGFLGGSGLTALAAALGAAIPFGRHFPAGLMPVALAQGRDRFEIPGKDPGLTVLNERPLSAETPAHLLDDEVTPAARLFVRNNGDPPAAPVREWRLEIAGEGVDPPRAFSERELRRGFETVTLQLQLECAGNGRSEFYPPVSGNQWTTGAIGCPEWNGVRLRDVLAACGVGPSAVYVGYYGTDRHLSGDPAKVPISRGVPIAKAMQPETLLAWGINGAPLPSEHGAPLRLVASGWPGSASGKWLQRIVVRDRVHDGPKMTGPSYRVPCSPVAAGAQVPDEEMCIIESMPVRSLLTHPRSGSVVSLGAPIEVRGHAWAGERSVERVDLSIDFGSTWKPATLAPPRNRFAWQRFRARLDFPRFGYYEVWARATDSAGVAQPMVVPGWNPRGYLNNACHRIALRLA